MMTMADRVKKLATVLLALSTFAIVLPASALVPTRAEGEEPAASYKAKCAMCHGAKAEKSFDAAKDDAALVDAVLKGVKPKMPSYDQKLTPNQAKALVAYMKSVGK
jgi:mono/diheme cytochrome c family protein